MSKPQAKKETDLFRTALYIGGAFLIYKLVKKVSGVISDPTGVNAQNEQLQNLISVNEQNLTYPVYNYFSWANQLEQTLLVDSTENETLVDNIIFQLHNDDDWKQLVKAFGQRIDYRFGFIPGGSYDLPGALKEFVSERINHYNNHFAGWNMQSRI